LEEKDGEESKGSAGGTSEQQVKRSHVRFEQILQRHKQRKAAETAQERTRRSHSDSAVVMQDEHLSYAVLDPHQDSLTQIATLTSDIQEMCDHLDAKETQIVKLSQQVGAGEQCHLLRFDCLILALLLFLVIQVAALTLELDKVNTLRVSMQKNLDEVTSQRNALRVEMGGLQTRTLNAEEDAAKHIEEYKRISEEFHEISILKHSMEDELERLTLSEQALALKVVFLCPLEVVNACR